MKKLVKPNAIIAGFPRCGTTYLYDVLKQHPQISLPEKKEINFFNIKPYFLSHPEYPSPRIFKSNEWYLRHFKKNKVVLDFAIMSCYDPLAAYRIKELLGDVKIIFITRNKEDHKKSIKGLIELHKGIPNDYEKYSDFERYIKPYRKLFKKVYVTSLEKIKTEEGLNELLRFLGVKRYKFKKPNTSKYKIEKAEFPITDYIKRRVYYFLCDFIGKFVQ